LVLTEIQLAENAFLAQLPGAAVFGVAIALEIPRGRAGQRSLDSQNFDVVFSW